MPRRFPINAGLRVILAELAMDIPEVCARAQLSPALLRQLPTSLTAAEYLRLWHSLVQSRDQSDVVLAVAKLAASTSFSPLLFACSCSPTYEIAVERLRAHKLLIGPIALRLEHTENTLTVTPEPAPEPADLPDSLAAAEVAYQKALIDHSTRENVQPVRVVLSEDLAQDDRMATFFGVRPHWGSEVSITFSLDDARRPFLTQDSAMWDYFEPELRRRLSAVEALDSAVELTRAALLELLPTGDAAIGTVARQLALSPRTLQRRLDREGTTYKEVLGTVRCELAEEYLAKEISTAEIAFLLAYSEVNSFLRAFKGWKGVTPEHYRQQSVH